MDNLKATATFFLDMRRVKKNNTYPVKLTIYFDGVKKRYNTGIAISEKDWNKIFVQNLRDDELKIIKRKLHNKKESAEQIIDKMEIFNFQEFEELYFAEKKIRRSILLEELFDEYINELDNKGRAGTSISYNTTKNSIHRFRTGMRISEVNLNFLEEYEHYMLSKGLSPSTIGIYLRQLRRIMNIAINRGLLSRDKYPFIGYSIPCSRNVKKALSMDQIRQLFTYKPKNGEIEKALDFWLFSYLSNGINMTDVCLLRPEDLNGHFFHYFRAKTKNTKKRDLRPIKVPLTERSVMIIEKWKNTDPSNPYLFPVLEAKLSPRQIKFRIQDFIWRINKEMKIVAKDLGIDQNIGTYVARHSHSTILKRKGVATEIIKENLGHSSILITEYYLDDFTDEVKRDYAKLLTDW